MPGFILKHSHIHQTDQSILDIAYDMVPRSAL